MKRTVRITESDITRLVKKIVNEQRREDDPTEDYFKIIDIVANDAMDEEDDLDEVERCINEIYNIMHEAYQDDDLSDEQADEIIDYATEVVKELETMFDSEEPNQRLGEGLLKEDESQIVDTVNDELSTVGEEPVSVEDVHFAMNDCPLETPPNVDEKQKTMLQKIKAEIDGLTSVKDVKELIKKIKSIFKRKTQSEQVGEIVTLGSMAIPVVFIQIFAGILILMLVVKLIRLIGGNTRTSPECRRASRRMRKYGPL